MPISDTDNKRLTELFTEYGGRFGGRREDYFALLYLTRKLQLEPEEVGHQIAFGGNDYGLDAYHIDRRAGNLYLYQFKWTEDHQQFKGSMERLAERGLQRIFGAAPSQDRRSNDVLHYLRRELGDYRQAVDRVFLQSLFKGDADAADASEGLTHRREDLEQCAHLLSAYFGRDVPLRVEVLSDRPRVDPPPPPQAHRVRVRGSITTEHHGRTMHVGFVPLADLHAIHAALGPRFFDRNIRAALPQDNAPNRKLRAAFERIVLRQDEPASVFAFRHNGVTLAAARVEVGSGALTLHTPRLLNGAQTVSTLARFLEREAGVDRAARQRLDQIEVLAKVVADDPSSDFVTGVTISNNQQNPVPPWALRAMDRRQVDLADKFRSEVRIYYSRQEGAFESLSDREVEEQGIESARDIRIKTLALTFLAVQGDVANMRSLSEVFENQRLYDATFRPEFLAADARRIVLAYKVDAMLRRVLTHLRDEPLKVHAASLQAGRNLVWALLVQGVLNDRRLPGWLDTFGRSLVRERDYGQILQTMAANKVSPLLKTLIALPANEKKVAVGRYDFLRTTESYRRAMAQAGERFGWSKQTF